MGDRDEPRLREIDVSEPLEFVIPKGTTGIGRAPGNGIVLRDSAVSRYHCYLVREGEEVKLFDSGGKNPVRVDGGAASGQPLKPGQVLQVGRFRLVYEEAASPDAPPEAAAQAAALPWSPPPQARGPVRPAALAAALRTRSTGQSSRPLDLALLWLLVLLVPAALAFLFVFERSAAEPTLAGGEGAAAAAGLETRIAELRREGEEKRLESELKI